MKGMLKKILSIAFVCCSTLHAQDSIKLLFTYGSKPILDSEASWFGGLHGGHVSISYNSAYASFVPAGGVHVFAKKRHKQSAFIIEKDENFAYDTTNARYLILTIPVSKSQAHKVDSLLQQRLFDVPYDYAFFGMRCASAAYEVLSNAGIYPRYSIRNMSFKYFYPKLLRKQLLKEAHAKGWHYYYRSGRKSRKWEKD
jgi:hypothetical protein